MHSFLHYEKEAYKMLSFPLDSVEDFVNAVPSKMLFLRNFPSNPVVKTLPSNAGRRGSIPGLGTRIPHAAGCGRNLKK